MPHLKFLTLDVFTSTPFAGNPLAVIRNADALSTDTMLAITREFGYSESVFLCEPSTPDTRHQLRIFTPGGEIPFAGHPIVGTAIALAFMDEANDRPTPQSYQLGCGAGPVNVHFDQRADSESSASSTQMVQFQAPKPFRRGVALDPASATAVVGLDVGDIDAQLPKPQTATVGLPFATLAVRDLATLGRCQCSRASFERHLPQHLKDGIFVYTRDPQATHHYRTRMFAPGDGIEEDPATGSASAALTGLLTDEGGPEQPDGSLIVFHQGVEMGRPSRIVTSATRSTNGVRVHVAGQAVVVTEGEFRLPR